MTISAPFGIEIYSSIEKFKIIDSYPDKKFRIDPPTVHPLFESFLIQCTPELGVVWIKGIGTYRSHDSFGMSLRSEVDRISEQLNLRYGRSKISDFVFPGALWEEPQYWMNALDEGQRHYGYTWDSESGAKLPSDIETIYAGAQSGGDGTGAMCVEYSSPRMREAESEIEKELSKLL